MRRKMRTALFILSALAITLLSSCSNNDDAINPDHATTGSLKIRLTDAPFPSERVDSVIITIDQVVIKKMDDLTTEETDESGFVVLSTESQAFDLLKLRNGTFADIADTSAIEVGTYREIRLHIAQALVYADESDQPFDLKIPSGTSSGLKIKIDGGVEIKGNLEAVVYLDFDVSRSFLVQGNPKDGAPLKGFKFKPVIRASAQDQSGSIEGTVSINDFDNENSVNPESLLVAILNSAGDTVSSAQPDMDGYYAVIGLLAGEYTVALSADGYDDVQLPTTVEPMQTTTIDITLNETLATVMGQVETSDGTTTTSLADVTVEVKNESLSTQTDSEGLFEINSIPPGDYTIKFSKTGYAPDSVEVSLGLGQVEDLGTLTMLPE